MATTYREVVTMSNPICPACGAPTAGASTVGGMHRVCVERLISASYPRLRGAS